MPLGSGDHCPFQRSRHPRKHGQTLGPVSSDDTSRRRNTRWFRLQRHRWAKEEQPMQNSAETL